MAKKYLLVLFLLSSPIALACQDGGSGACGNQGWSGNTYNPTKYDNGYSNRGYSTGGGFFPPTTYTPVPYVPNWGAVAFSDSKESKVRESFAYSEWNTSKKMAENDAKEKCENKTKTPCRIIASYTDTCATGIQGYNNKKYEFWVATTTDAIDQGFAVCKKKGYKNCKVVFSSCVLDTGTKP